MPPEGATPDEILSTARGARRAARLPRRKASAADLQELRRRVYAPSDLSGYGFKDRLVIYAADLLLYLLIRVIGMTIRWEARGMDRLQSIYAGGRRAIFTSWHSCIVGATYFFRDRGIVVMSSRSRDAEYTGRVIKRFGYGTARGSSTRGGGRAMAEMAECLLNGIDVGFTIDGPRGPAYVAKPGAVTLARHTGQAVFPFHVAARSYWELPSWDRLQIPKPFTRAVVLIGEPIHVPPDAGPEEVEAKQAELQSTLAELRVRSSEFGVQSY